MVIKLFVSVNFADMMYVIQVDIQVRDVVLKALQKLVAFILLEIMIILSIVTCTII